VTICFKLSAGSGWLFIDGVMPLEKSDLLALLAHGDEVWLLAAGAVFATTSDCLAVVGAYDEWPGDLDASRATLYLFDGRVIAPPEPQSRRSPVSPKAR
jgi:hypothetical protein